MSKTKFISENHFNQDRCKVGTNIEPEYDRKVLIWDFLQIVDVYSNH